MLVLVFSLKFAYSTETLVIDVYYSPVHCGSGSSDFLVQNAALKLVVL